MPTCISQGGKREREKEEFFFFLAVLKGMSSSSDAGTSKEVEPVWETLGGIFLLLLLLHS